MPSTPKAAASHPLRPAPASDRADAFGMPGAPDVRAFCYTCHKPKNFCLCSLAEPVDNTCAITILQHPRERHHPIGTARLARLALQQAEVVVCWQLLAPTALAHRADASWGVLFPSPHAQDLSVFDAKAAAEGGPPATLPAVQTQKPERLIVLDGTWAHARSLYRENPWLWALPHFCITPKGPDRYRIRREPKAEYTSTLEAIVTALVHLEPQTPGLAGILGAFDTMIDRQVRCIETLHVGARRRLRPRSRPRSRGIPQPLLEHPERTIVVFAEFMQHTSNDKTSREMVYLTAQHLVTGNTLTHFVKPIGQGPSERHLAHMQLTSSDVTQNVIDSEDLGPRWRAFAGPNVHVLAWNQASLDLVMPLCEASGARSWLLKAMFAAAHKQRGGTLGDAVAHSCVIVEPAQAKGRAAVRLGSAVAIAKKLLSDARGHTAQRSSARV